MLAIACVCVRVCVCMRARVCMHPCMHAHILAGLCVCACVCVCVLVCACACVCLYVGRNSIASVVYVPRVALLSVVSWYSSQRAVCR